MTHAQKPDFVFRRNRRVYFNRPAEASVQSTAGSRGVRISGSNAGYTMFRGSMKGTGYLLHSPVSPSLPLTCVTLCHHIVCGVVCVVSVWCVCGVVWVCKCLCGVCVCAWCGVCGECLVCVWMWCGCVCVWVCQCVCVCYCVRNWVCVCHWV